MSDISIVITTHNSSTTLPQLLASINNSKCNEVIVVDSSPNDVCKNISIDYGAKFFKLISERSAKRNFGMSVANGSYCVLADSDMIFTEELLNELNLEIQNDPSLVAMFIREQSVGPGYWTSCKILERDSIRNQRYLAVARFVNTETALSFGGFDENNTGTEDYDFQRKLETISSKKEIKFTKNKIIHDEKRIELFNHLTKKFFYSSSIGRYLSTGNSSQFFQQINLLKRYQLICMEGYRNKHKMRIILGALTLKTLEFLAGGIGFLTAPISRNLSSFVYRKPK